MWRIIFAILLSGIAACTQHSAGNHVQKVPPPPSLTTDANPKHAGLDAFYKLCLNSGETSDDMIRAANELGYKDASDIQLASLKLEALRKSTLVIPGGGAFISETQSIMIGPKSTNNLVLVVENQFAKKKHIKTECSIHDSKSKQLETCTTLGYMLKRAPTSNTRYTSQNSHFVEWEGKANRATVRISCSGATQAQADKFAGTRIGAKYLHVKRAGTLGAKLKRLSGNTGS